MPTASSMVTETLSVMVLRLLTRKKAPFGDSTPKRTMSAMTMTAMPTGVDRTASARRPGAAGGTSGAGRAASIMPPVP